MEGQWEEEQPSLLCSACACHSLDAAQVFSNRRESRVSKFTLCHQEPLFQFALTSPRGDV